MLESFSVSPKLRKHSAEVESSACRVDYDLGPLLDVQSLLRV
jgi:hypothetical protein